MAKSNIYVGLEIGTSKVCMVVGEVKGDGAIKILGVGQAPSRGVRKGEIVDYDNAQTCLHEALVRAEDRSAGGNAPCGGREDGNVVGIAGTASGPGTVLFEDDF